MKVDFPVLPGPTSIAYLDMLHGSTSELPITYMSVSNSSGIAMNLLKYVYGGHAKPFLKPVRLIYVETGMIHRPLTMSLTLASIILGAKLIPWKVINMPLSTIVCLLMPIHTLVGITGTLLT